MFTSQMIKKKIKSDYILFSAHKIVVWRNMVAVKVTIHRDLVSKSSLGNKSGDPVAVQENKPSYCKQTTVCSQKNKGGLYRQKVPFPVTFG